VLDCFFHQRNSGKLCHGQRPEVSISQQEEAEILWAVPASGCLDWELSMFVRYVWAFRTRVLKTRVPERAFWVNPFFQWYKVNLFPGFEQRNLFPPLKKRRWSSCGLKVVYEATRKLIFPTPDPFWVRPKRFWPHRACAAS
jgi:hypothetical protein